jgi:hypothetical protein
MQGQGQEEEWLEDILISVCIMHYKLRQVSRSFPCIFQYDLETSFLLSAILLASCLLRKSVSAGKPGRKGNKMENITLNIANIAVIG